MLQKSELATFATSLGVSYNFVNNRFLKGCTESQIVKQAKEHLKCKKGCHKWRNGRYTIAKLASLYGCSSPTMSKRIRLMGVNRAMSDEKTPHESVGSHGDTTKRIYPLSDPEKRLQVCTKVVDGFRRKCKKYEKCWHGEKSVKRCSGRDLADIEREYRQPTTLNGTAISRGCPGLGLPAMGKY